MLIIKNKLFPQNSKGLVFNTFVVLIFIVYIFCYKLLEMEIFVVKSKLSNGCTTGYGGVYTGEDVLYVQKSEYTCGQSVLAYFLTKVGINETEETIINYLDTDGMLSLADLEKVFIAYGFNTQVLKIKPSFFRKNPKASILHLKTNHFIVFLNEHKKETIIFDPMYGLVYLPWKRLLKIISGYMLYIYE